MNKSKIIAVLILISIVAFLVLTSNTGDLKKRLLNTDWDIRTSEGDIGTIKFNTTTADFSIQCNDGTKEQIHGKFEVNNYTREIKIANSKKELIISVANTKFNEFENGTNSVSIEGFGDYTYPNTVDGIMEKQD